MKILLVTLLCVFSLFAHKLNVFATLEEKSIVVESYFGGGKGCQECRISVFDVAGNLLSTCQSDEVGQCILANPNLPYVRIEALASQGHKGEFVLENGKSAQRPNERGFNIFAGLILIFLLFGAITFFKRK